MSGLIRKEDVTQELRPSRVKRDNEDLQKVMKHIRDTNNPFDENFAPEVLYNISTGKGTNEHIRESLLQSPARGKTRHKEFIGPH